MKYLVIKIKIPIEGIMKEALNSLNEGETKRFLSMSSELFGNRLMDSDVISEIEESEEVV